MELNLSVAIAGDIILTRKATDNRSPGYWNHCAIYRGNNIVEAQGVPFNKVICVPVESFLSRYTELAILRCDNDKVVKSICDVSVELLGKSYRKYASIFRRVRGFNCVSLVEYIVQTALNNNHIDIDLHWVFPDDIFTSDFLLKVDLQP